MLMRRDFDLNSVDLCADSAHAYTDSLKDTFKRTMLSQEIVFQNQVHELHRIYWMQKTLMQGNSWMDFDQYTLNKVDSVHSKNQEFFCRLQQRPFGCKSPANYYTGHVGHTDNLKLSLSVGDGNRRKQSGKRTWFDLKFAGDVIDLEESTETISNNDSGNAHSFSCATLTVNSGHKHDSQKSVLTKLIMPSGLKKNQSSDLERCDRNLSSTNKQQTSSYVTLDFDLNKVYCDDSSCHSNDPTITHPSTPSSSDVFHGLVGRAEEGSSESQTGTKECNNFSSEASGIRHLNDAQNSLPVNSKGNYERTETQAGHPIFDELRSSDEVLGPSQEFGCQTKDPNNGIVKYTLEVSKSQIHECPAKREAHIEKEKSQGDVLLDLDHSKSTVQDGHGDIYSASPKHCQVGDNESSNAETAQLRNPLHIDTDVDNKKGFQAQVTLSSEKNLSSSCSSKEETDGVDILVREAAESLIHICVESLACHQDFSVTENMERATPQCSSDSFERFTLGLKDCAVDDMCVSSKLAEVDLTENKDYGLKIRRGRRLKDFQRDILPGLASLSRHEIREDINILEGVLRSREYRKMQAKMADDGHSWCAPARSRRSRLNCTKRRRFS